MFHQSGGFHPIRGWRKVEVHFGAAIPPEKYLDLPREEFVEFVRQSIMTARDDKPGTKD